MMDLPKRKRIRLKDYDYSQNGLYFITICVKDMHEMLGKVIDGENPNVPYVILSEYGEILQKYINEIDNQHKSLLINNYVIMPNHVHFLIFVNGFDHLNDRTTSQTISNANATIPSFVAMLKRFVHKDCGFTLFQRAYHDHIVRNSDEYEKIYEYIDKNPLKWAEDRYYNL